MELKAQKKESGVIVTPPGRASFAHVFQPNPRSAQGKYTMSLIFDKTPANLEFYKTLKKEATRVALEKWGEKVKGMKLKELPLHDGSEKELDGYGPDKFFINFTSNRRPGVVDQNKQPILNASDFYSGCYARASINVYAYDNKFGKGVSFGMNNVQKISDGEPFGGGTNPDDDFETVASPANDASFYGDENDDLFGGPETDQNATNSEADIFA